MALLILSGCTAKFVDHFVPGIRRSARLQNFPVPLDLRTFAQRHQLQRPQQDLPEVANALGLLPAAAVLVIVVARDSSQPSRVGLRAESGIGARVVPDRH